jgi:hypothetical protein
VKLIVDVSLSPSWVEYLAGHGISSEHWSRVGALVVAVIRETSPHLDRGALVTCEVDKLRVRILPLIPGIRTP